MITLAPFLMIGSSSFSQGTSTTIKARISSKFDEIGPRTVELAAFGRFEKFQKTYNGRIVVSGHNNIAFISVWIFFIFAGNKDNYKSSDVLYVRPHPIIDY